MRYLKAAAAVLVIVVIGGTMLRQVDADTWVAHAITLTMAVTAALAARRMLRQD